MVRNQICNLTLGPSFGHNLCFKYSNGSCELILNIYILRNVQWYKVSFNPMSFDPCNRLLKIRKSIGIPTPKVGVHLGVQENVGEWTPTFPSELPLWECGGSFPHTLLHSREHEMWLLGFTLGPQLCKPLPWSRA
jgi:hypothetical protein